MTPMHTPTGPTATTPTANHERAPSIGELCFGGDWACAHGDFGTLREIALRLADHFPDRHFPDRHVPDRACRALRELGTACVREPDRAAELWATVRRLVCRRDAT